MQPKKNPVAQEMARVEASEIESNPLFRLEQGEQLSSSLPENKKSAKSGNLFFEYVQNVEQLRGIVRSGRDVAIYLESKNLIAYDRTADRYVWTTEPLSKAEFLRMVLPGLRKA